MPALAQAQTVPRPSAPPPGRVPLQWIGRARLLRERVAAADARWGAAAEQLTPLVPRNGFQPQFTKQSLSVLAARWRNLPEWGRLRIASKIRGDHLQVCETRLVPYRVAMAGWNDVELAIAAVLWTTEMRLPTHFTTTVSLVAAVGLHAISRRYERGGDRRDTAVLRDLMPVPQGWADAVRSGGEFEIPTNSGRWIGSVMSFNGMPVLAIRTFVAS